jgi:hypothetical protein
MDVENNEFDDDDDMQFSQSLMVETVPSYIADLSSHHRNYIANLQSCKGMSVGDINNSFILSSLEVFIIIYINCHIFVIAIEAISFE